jgi:hypothetical protein
VAGDNPDEWMDLEGAERRRSCFVGMIKSPKAEEAEDERRKTKDERRKRKLCVFASLRCKKINTEF